MRRVRIERTEDLVAYVLDGTLAVDVDVMRRARISARAPVQIVVDERFRLAVVRLDAFLDRRRVIIRPLDERLTGDVVFPCDFRGIEVDVVAAPGSRMYAAPAH